MAFHKKLSNISLKVIYLIKTFKNYDNKTAKNFSFTLIPSLKYYIIYNLIFK